VDRHVTLPFIAELRVASGLPSEEPADGAVDSPALGATPTS
jgi:hypothetical protein